MVTGRLLQHIFPVHLGALTGIGRGLVETLLARPDTTVIACVRDLLAALAKSLSSIPVAANTKLITAKVDSWSDTDALDAIASLQTDHGITTIDFVVANAGIMADMDPVIQVSPQSMRDSFQINTIAPLLLFRATLPLLLSSQSGDPRFILIGSLGASITLGPKAGCPLAAYGSTKAASHYVVSEIHSEHGKNIIAWVFHPGLVDTQMGRRFSEASGYPLFTVQQCVDMFLEQAEKSTKETHGGLFIGYNGKEVPW
ncbi:short-chain dehydrogenase [Cadophora sp. MPI-SDFR-AT-0126]|nr:short-chain dehydrogenase [Leotiomycetes sp. MPI-SDFR-AT-0126]